MRSTAYVSKAVGEWKTEDHDALLKHARGRNTDDGISGLLIFCNGWFLQVVEGPDAPVAALLARIADDPRHSDVAMIYNQEIDEPVFPDWSMGFEKVDTSTLVREMLSPAVDQGLISAEMVRDVLAERFLVNSGT